MRAWLYLGLVMFGCATDGETETDTSDTPEDTTSDTTGDTEVTDTEVEDTDVEDTEITQTEGWALVEVDGTTTLEEMGGVLTLQTNGTAYITAELPVGMEGFSVDVGAVDAGNRVSFFIEAEDSCGNEASYVLGAQVMGNVKGWLYTCDYLNGDCGLDDKECDAPAGTSGLRDGQSYGVWLKDDGTIVQSLDGSASESTMTGFVDPSATTARRYGIYVESGGDDMTVTLTNLQTSVATASGNPAGPCSRETPITCD